MASSRRPTSRLVVSVDVTEGAAADTRGLAAWLGRAAPRAARGALALAVVSDAHMRRLNRDHRGVDEATDVLSFPAGDQAAGHGEPGFLGDIAIAGGVAARQARAEGHPRRVEFRILALHGLLHLLGYDHESDDGTMRRVEDRLRRKAGLPQGLTGRAGGQTENR